MRLHFRPFPGLTIFTVISLAILIALGTWQYQRLQWKTALLAEVEQAVTAPPMSSLSEVGLAMADSIPVDFRRISFQAEIIPGQSPFLVYSPRKRELMWRPFYAAKDAGKNSSGKRSYIALAAIPDSGRDNISLVSTSMRELSGYIRTWRPTERGSAKSTPELNRWFGFDSLRNVDPWEDGPDDIFINAPVDTQFYIDVVDGAASADTLPIKRPEIRNNHFDYMLTWYGLAVVLFVIYLILHRQRGRLGFKES